MFSGSFLSQSSIFLAQYIELRDAGVSLGAVKIRNHSPVPPQPGLMMNLEERPCSQENHELHRAFEYPFTQIHYPANTFLSLVVQVGLKGKSIRKKISASLKAHVLLEWLSRTHQPGFL